VEDERRLIACRGCGALVPDVAESPVYHQGASPGCWQRYLEFLVAEHEEYGYPDVHRLTTDCYAAQHPLNHPKTVRSLNVHLISLCCIIERGYQLSRATKVMAGITNTFKEQFTWLEPPASMGEITILDVADTKGLDEYRARVYEWAKYLWTSWEAHHVAIRAYVDQLEKNRR